MHWFCKFIDFAFMYAFMYVVTAKNIKKEGTEADEKEKKGKSNEEEREKRTGKNGLSSVLSHSANEKDSGSRV